MKTSKNYPSITLFIVLSIAVLAFFTYKGTLHRFFADGDSLTLIETNRVYSLKDVGRIFSQPEAYNTVTASRARFFRPVSMLSFSLDYSLWKVNPFGYHLTNIVLHILVSTALFFLLRLLTRGHRLAAWLGACLFVIHPSVVEVVPDISRRLDILVALFHLLSLILFIKYYSGATRKKNYLFLSLVFFALSLWSKEIGVILPILIFVYLMLFIFHEAQPLKMRFLFSFRGTIPYLVMTFILLSWRVYVVKGIGGYLFKPSEIFEKAILVGEITLNYIADLLHPLGYFSYLFKPNPSLLEKILFLGILLSLIILFYAYRKRLFLFIVCETQGLIKVLKTILVLVIIISLIFILSYPLIAPYVNHLVEQAYYDQGPKLLTKAMKWRYFYPVEYYFFRARDSIITPIFLFMLFSATTLAVIHIRNKAKSFFLNTLQGRSIVFLLVWMLLPLCVYLATLTFSHWCIYIAVVPFSAILGILLVETFKSAFSHRTSLVSSRRIIFIIVVAFAFSFLFFSPLVRTYGEWKDSGNISKILLDKLSGIVEELPDDAHLHLYNLPVGILSYEFKIPHAKSVGYLFDAGIKSWLDLNYPGNKIEVFIYNLSRPFNCPSDLDLELLKGEDNNITIIIRYTF